MSYLIIVKQDVMDSLYSIVAEGLSLEQAQSAVKSARREYHVVKQLHESELSTWKSFGLIASEVGHA